MRWLRPEVLMLSSAPSYDGPGVKESIRSRLRVDGECARCVWGEERIGHTTRPEIRSASYGEPLVGSSMLAQPGIDFDAGQFQPCGNEHFKNGR